MYYNRCLVLKKTHVFGVRLDEASWKALNALMKDKGVGKSQAVRLALIYTYLNHIKGIHPEIEPQKAEEAIMRLIINSF